MKLLVVSHACATPLNQSFYADVEEVTGWSLSLVLPSSWKTEYNERHAERWPAFRGAFHALPVWKSGSIPLHTYKNTFTGLLRSEKPDAIYVQHEPYGVATAQVYLANRLSGKVPIGFYAAQNIRKEYPIPFRWTERIILRDSAFSFPVTNEAREVLEAKGFKGDAEVLPLAVDSKLYQPKPEEARAVRLQLGIAEAEPVIGYLGRLVPEKGLLTLVAALARLRDLTWRCVLAGSGPLEAELKRAIAAAKLTDRVILPGYVPHTETPAWMSMFDVLALPSETQANWKEQFGRVIVEANACGTPVLGTRCGEIPAVIGHTGGGMIVDERSPEQLAAALQQFIEQPEFGRGLAERGMALVRREYDQRYLASRFAATIARNVPGAQASKQPLV